MARIEHRRLTADVEGDFVVFMIGMRVNRPWKLHRWLPVFLAMPRMLRAHLPASVASFLAGGGRRCYVIRVADRQQASTALFPVAGAQVVQHIREIVEEDFHQLPSRLIT